jgi:hypothetical protein
MAKQVKRWEAAVRRHLPTGSPKVKVEEFLVKNKLEYRPVGGGALGVSITNCPTSSSLIRGHIEMRFHFDEPDGLSSYTVRSGPG